MSVYRLGDDLYADWSDNADRPYGPLQDRASLREDLVRDATRASRHELGSAREAGDDRLAALVEEEIALQVRRVDLRLERADAHGTSELSVDRPMTPAELVAGNRAGPRESCLTLAAVLRRYSPDPQVRDGFVLGPDDIEVGWTNDWDEDGNDVYVWVPWPPGRAPAEITDGTDLHARVLIGPEPPSTFA